ncbi:putative RND efflux membrane fusion protein [Enhygromyxa salina]|uniref:Putative RND efflux membrane fusion protein n=1 Tax=Enhygromyxa salina TaxID=215803 RepID=A0A0C2DFU8_9BACT|nr:putative RND efflux membrane fusion protein [Enhygromyxa salina]
MWAALAALLVACAPGDPTTTVELSPAVTLDPSARAQTEADSSGQPSRVEPDGLTELTELTDLIGVVVPARAVDVAPSLAGELVEVRVQPGDRVVAGQVLAILDDRRIREDLSIAEAELRRQRAGSAAAELDATQRAQAADQLEALAAQGHVPALVLDEAVFAAKRSAATLEQADASVAESRARIARLRRQLEDSALTSPFTGVVAQRYLDGGAVTGPSSPILRLIDVDTLWVRFAVEPEALAGVALGDQVTVRFEAGGETRAQLRHVAPQVDPVSELVVIEAALMDASASASAIGIGIGAAALVDFD